MNFELRLECGTRSVENAVMNVCHWGEPNVDGVKGYKVWRAIGDNGREVIGRTEGHEWSERNAKAGLRYAYAVEAVGEGGVSLGYSNTVVVALPVPPLALKLTCVPKVIESKLGVVCEWSAVERDGVRAYQLWRKVGDGARELVDDRAREWSAPLLRHQRAARPEHRLHGRRGRRRRRGHRRQRRRAGHDPERDADDHGQTSRDDSSGRIRANHHSREVMLEASTGSLPITESDDAVVFPAKAAASSASAAGRASIGRASTARQPGLRRALPKVCESCVCLCLQRSGSTQVAEDVTSTTFERALRGMPTFEWRSGGFGAWLFRIAANELTNHYRRQGRTSSDKAQRAFRMYVSEAVSGGEFDRVETIGSTDVIREAMTSSERSVSTGDRAAIPVGLEP